MYLFIFEDEIMYFLKPGIKSVLIYRLFIIIIIIIIIAVVVVGFCSLYSFYYVPSYLWQ